MANKDDTVVDKGLDAQAHIYHIDGRVTAIESQISGVVQQLNRMEGALLNKEPFFNFGNVTTLMLMVAGLLYGINGFVDLRMTQVQQDTDRNEMAVKDLQEFQREVHYEIGQYKARAEENDSRRLRNEAWIRGIDGRVRKTEEQAAASEVSRRAIGDFVEDVDKYGSRKWIDKGKHQ